ncbi:MAG TPA: sugar transferase [Bacteroidales bacterium]|nr:sugar transferase [Bacteroidales bacterium]HPJ60190.1 sugar transferase [Bacteroidales bacterium]HPR13108.1 sugar transferase [Bacteroidales bacterium]
MIKRTFDIVAALIGLIIASPVMLVISILIKLLMPGPVFFRQYRTGRNGKPFQMIKFRTMLINNDPNTTSVLGDRRVTPPGRFLRRYKLDELPELWNVLKGDMSMVGPRPDMPEFTDRLSGEERKILQLRPGITGPASVKYSREEELLAGVPDPVKYTDEVIWPDKVRINLEYYHNRTFLKDMLLIIRTVFH